MRYLTDRRYLVIYFVNTKNGEFSKERVAEIWQNQDGLVFSPSSIKDTLNIVEKDLLIQASEAFLSPIEWLRIRLLRCPNIMVEVTGK